jgi:hypothetical protein
MLEKDGDDQLDRKKNYIEPRRRGISYKQREGKKEGKNEG